MWGNALGWFLSFVLLGFLLLGMHGLEEIARISKPTKFGEDPANLAAVELPIAPSTLIEMNGGDAKPLYRAAIDDYLSNKDQYDRFQRSKNATDAKSLAGLKDLLDATHASTAKIFADDPGEIVTYREKPGLEALAALGKSASSAALAVRDTDLERAISWLESEFSLGAKLYHERLTLTEFDLGLGLMSESSAELTRLLPKSGRADRGKQFQDFYETYLEYDKTRMKPMRAVLDAIDANVIGEHAGDIIYFARHCSERMYRVEAILAMGRLRYFVGENGRIGNQRGAMTELKSLANDPDPVIRRAATEARDLTEEQYRMMK